MLAPLTDLKEILRMKISVPSTLPETIHFHLTRTCAALMLILSMAWLGNGWIPPAAAGERTLKANDIKPELLYHNYCSVCHGDRGDGHSRASTSLVPPPRDFTTATNLTREIMIAIVTNGKPGTAMTGWKTQLNDKEIEAVVDYIRNGFMQAALDPQVARGRSVYGHYCATCHGESGKGPLVTDARMTTPPDLSSPKAKSELNRERLIASITHGKPGTAMEGFNKKLAAQDIDAVADYLLKVIMVGPVESISGTHARGGQSQVAPAAIVNAGKPTSASADLPLPKGLTGNPQRGKKFYLANCSACHGAKGDGQGPRAYFISPKPRNFLDKSSAGFNRPMLFAAISMGKNGTVMPAWNKIMDDQQIADISEYVYRTFIRANANDRAGNPGK